MHFVNASGADSVLNFNSIKLLGTINGVTTATYTVPAGTTADNIKVVVNSIYATARGDGAYAGGNASASGAAYSISISGTTLNVTTKSYSGSASNNGSGNYWQTSVTVQPTSTSVYYIG